MEDSSSEGLHSKQLYSLAEPYPIPKVICENHYYASILLEDYAGIFGELTAINQYIYHYITLQDSYPEISILTRQVAITEMHHLELLGKIIQLLGELPVMHFADYDVMKFWNAKFVYYNGDVYDKLSANIKHEATAIHNYRSHQQQIDDPFIRKVLERIILDEKYHLQLFLKIRDEVVW